MNVHGVERGSRQDGREIPGPGSDVLALPSPSVRGESLVVMVFVLQLSSLVDVVRTG